MMSDIVDPRIAVLVVWAFFFLAFIVIPSLCLRCVGWCSAGSFLDGGGMGVDNDPMASDSEGRAAGMWEGYGFLSARKREELDGLRGAAIGRCLEGYSLELGREHMVKLPPVRGEDGEDSRGGGNDPQARETDGVDCPDQTDTTERDMASPDDYTRSSPDDFINEEAGLSIPEEGGAPANNTDPSSASDEGSSADLSDFTHVRIPPPGCNRDGIEMKENPTGEATNKSCNRRALPFFQNKVQVSNDTECCTAQMDVEGDTTSATISMERRDVPGFCAICLGEYGISQSIAWSSNPECTHVFHRACIARWLDSLGRKALGRWAGRVPESLGTSSLLLEYRLECPCCRQEFVAGAAVGSAIGRGEENV